MGEGSALQFAQFALSLKGENNKKEERMSTLAPSLNSKSKEKNIMNPAKGWYIHASSGAEVCKQLSKWGASGALLN